jgi:hypothetical protein
MNLSALLKKIGALFMAIVSFVSLIGYLNSEESYDVSGNILYGGTGYDINAAPLKQTSTSTAADFYVSPTGSDSNDGKNRGDGIRDTGKGPVTRCVRSSLARGTARHCCPPARRHLSHTGNDYFYLRGFRHGRVCGGYRNYPGETPVLTRDRVERVAAVPGRNISNRLYRPRLSTC